MKPLAFFLILITTPIFAEPPDNAQQHGGASVPASLPPYQRMDFGPVLFWTLQVAPGNIAQKGIAIRLDDGPGGDP